MNPIGIALLLVGYGLVLPVATKMNSVVKSQNRLALTGHQFGILVVCLGWMVGGRVPLVWIHLLWAVIAVIWFNWFGTSRFPASARRTRPDVDRDGQIP